MGTAGGIAVLTPPPGNLFLMNTSTNTSIWAVKAVNWFCENEEGIWIGSNDGLFLLSSEGTQIQKADGLLLFISFTFTRNLLPVLAVDPGVGAYPLGP